MSEKLHNQSQEHIKSHEAHSSDHEKKHLKDLHEKAKNAHEISQDSIDAIKDSIDRTALKSEDYQLTEKILRIIQNSIIIQCTHKFLNLTFLTTTHNC